MKKDKYSQAKRTKERLRERKEQKAQDLSLLAAHAKIDQALKFSPDWYRRSYNPKKRK